MVRGFYQLGSGIMSQNKNLSTIANNIANAETTGYKKQMIVTESFENMMISRVNSLDSNAGAQLGAKSMIRTVSETASIHTQGVLKETGRDLDVAIVGEGFFALQTNNGITYTRKGDFNVDSEGYLTQGESGRVMGTNGPIRTGTDNVEFDSNGNVYADGQNVGRIATYNFADYNQLTPVKDGYYTSSGGAQQVNTQVKGKTLEGSNVDMSEEITNAIASQRELQTQSQVLKMYDSVLQKATTEIGKLT
ncbi:MAG: flagellar hook-basal body complex protein [Clostridia bacterium]|nr:flagellar hook-basal body complex protein [Clostridia bacterium]